MFHQKNAHKTVQTYPAGKKTFSLELHTISVYISKFRFSFYYET